MIFILVFGFLFADLQVYTDGSIVVEKSYNRARNLLKQNLYKKAIKTYIDSSFSLNNNQRQQVIAKIYPNLAFYIKSFKVEKENLVDDVLSMKMNVVLDDNKLKNDLVAFGILGSSTEKSLSTFIYTRAINTWIPADNSVLEKQTDFFATRGLSIKNMSYTLKAPIVDRSDILYSSVYDGVLGIYFDRVCKNTCIKYIYATLIQNSTWLSELYYTKDNIDNNSMLRKVLSSLFSEFTESTLMKNIHITFKDLTYNDYKKIKIAINSSSGIVAKLKELYNSAGAVVFTVNAQNVSTIRKVVKHLCKVNGIYVPFYVKEVE